MRKYYDENKQKEFSTPADRPGTFRASHILIMVDDKADDAAKKAALDQINAISAELKKDPARFEALAREKSGCPSKAKGGSLDSFSDKEMVPEFQKALEGLKEGEISAPVKTQFGYHIIRRDALQTEGTTIPFEKVKGDIESFLKAQKDVEEKQQQQKAVMEFFQQLEKEYGVKYLIPMPEELGK